MRFVSDVVDRFLPTQLWQTCCGLLHKPKSLFFVAFFTLLFLPNVRLPSVPADKTHDLGSQMSYEFYAKNGYQFGVEVIHNVGPYGYLQFPDLYSGLLATQKVIFTLAFAAVFSTAALLATRYFATPLAVALWLLPLATMQFAIGPLINSLPLDTGAFSPLDPIFYLFLLLASHHLLMRDRYGSTAVFDIVLLIFLALLSLTKGTNLMLVAAIMAVTLFQDIKDRKFGRALSDAGSFVIAFGAFWLLAGQRLVNLPAFVRGVSSYSKGYSETMELSFPGEDYLVALAVVVFLAFLTTNIFRLRRFGEFRARLPLTVLEAAILFIVWKHGYTRADHVIFFWTFVLPASSLLFLAHEPPV